MGETKNMELLIQSQPPTANQTYSKLARDHYSWMTMDHKDDHLPSPSPSPSSSSSFDSSGTSTSEGSSYLVDDASSSPLYGLYSDLINHLPIKRGLSKHYNGESQSFTSLSKVMSVEDLAKKERFCRRKMKACKSIGAGLDHKLSPTSPKPAICKKSSRNTHLSFVCHPTTRNTCSSSFAPPPPSPGQSNLQC